MPDRTPARRLGLRAGEWVEVRPLDEIVDTLDEAGTLDALPFMPEMAHFCGRRYRVRHRADKTCDTIGRPISLRMTDAVHLEGLRCDGSGHAGCQARCLIFWKEAWLVRAEGPGRPDTGASESEPHDPEIVRRLASWARRPSDEPGEDDLFVCQATELQRATTPLAWWQPGQYWRELRSGNVSPGAMLATLGRAVFNDLQRRRGGLPRPSVDPKCDGPTPVRRLDLQPGELVRIRAKQDIEETLDSAQKNRGLFFDVEMVPYCGETTRVLDRVERIVDEKTGRLLEFGSDCIMLEDVTCGGCLSHDRLFCPRAIYSFWREIWLERVDDPAGASPRSEGGGAPAGPDADGPP